MCERRTEYLMLELVARTVTAVFCKGFWWHVQLPLCSVKGSGGTYSYRCVL